MERLAHIYIAILSVIVTYTVYLLTVVIYNVTLHPLAKFPGPKLWAAFHFVQYWYSTNGTSAAKIKTLHDKYGEVVRISPTGLSFNGSQAWQDIYGHKKGRKELEKDKNTFFQLPGSTPHIIVADNTNHMRMRKLLNHAFSDSALREQEPLIRDYTDLLITRLYDQIASPLQGQIDIAKWLNFTTFDILGDLAFGESFSALEKGETHYFVSTIFKSIKITTVLRAFNAYPLTSMILNALLTWVPALVKPRRDLEKYTKETVTRRLGKETEKRDFLTYITRHNDERGMTMKEIYASSVILIMAGSETTATLLSGLIFYLLKSPETFEKVKREVREAFQSQSEMNFSTEAKLPYLQACIEEALRIYPPLPAMVPRMTSPEGNVVNGLFVPGNTSVGVHWLSAGHSERNFKEPDKFIPERWLGEACFKDDDRSASQPFSIGQRGCIGKNFAYAEARAILVQLLWNFDIELCDESANWIEQRVFTVWDKKPLLVKLSARKR